MMASMGERKHGDGGGGSSSDASDGGGGGGGSGDPVLSQVQLSGLKWRVRMRCSSGAPLAAILHAEDKTAHPSPLCTMCAAGAHEDQVHVMTSCSRYDEARATMAAAVTMHWASETGRGLAAEQQRWQQWDGLTKAVWLLSTSLPLVTMSVNSYLHKVFTQRGAVVRARAAEAARKKREEAARATAAGVKPSEKWGKRPDPECRRQRRLSAKQAAGRGGRAAGGRGAKLARGGQGRGSRGSRGGKNRGRAGRGRGGGGRGDGGRARSGEESGSLLLSWLSGEAAPGGSAAGGRGGASA